MPKIRLRPPPTLTSTLRDALSEPRALRDSRLNYNPDSNYVPQVNALSTVVSNPLARKIPPKVLRRQRKSDAFEAALTAVVPAEPDTTPTAADLPNAADQTVSMVAPVVRVRNPLRSMEQRIPPPPAEETTPLIPREEDSGAGVGGDLPPSGGNLASLTATVAPEQRHPTVKPLAMPPLLQFQFLPVHPADNLFKRLYCSYHNAREQGLKKPAEKYHKLLMTKIDLILEWVIQQCEGWKINEATVIAKLKRILNHHSKNVGDRRDHKQGLQILIVLKQFRELLDFIQTPPADKGEKNLSTGEEVKYNHALVKKLSSEKAQAILKAGAQLEQDNDYYEEVDILSGALELPRQKEFLQVLAKLHRKLNALEALGITTTPYQNEDELESISGERARDPSFDLEGYQADLNELLNDFFRLILFLDRYPGCGGLQLYSMVNALGRKLFLLLSESYFNAMMRHSKVALPEKVHEIRKDAYFFAIAGFCQLLTYCYFDKPGNLEKILQDLGVVPGALQRLGGAFVAWNVLIAGSLGAAISYIIGTQISFESPPTPTPITIPEFNFSDPTITNRGLYPFLGNQYLNYIKDINTTETGLHLLSNIATILANNTNGISTSVESIASSLNVDVKVLKGILIGIALAFGAIFVVMNYEGSRREFDASLLGELLKKEDFWDPCLRRLGKNFDDARQVAGAFTSEDPARRDALLKKLLTSMGIQVNPRPPSTGRHRVIQWQVSVAPVIYHRQRTASRAMLQSPPLLPLPAQPTAQTGVAQQTESDFEVSSSASDSQHPDNESLGELSSDGERMDTAEATEIHVEVGGAAEATNTQVDVAPPPPAESIVEPPEAAGDEEDADEASMTVAPRRERMLKEKPEDKGLLLARWLAIRNVWEPFATTAAELTKRLPKDCTVPNENLSLPGMVISLPALVVAVKRKRWEEGMPASQLPIVRGIDLSTTTAIDNLQQLIGVALKQKKITYIVIKMRAEDSRVGFMHVIVDPTGATYKIHLFDPRGQNSISRDIKDNVTQSFSVKKNKSIQDVCPKALKLTSLSQNIMDALREEMKKARIQSVQMHVHNPCRRAELLSPAASAAMVCAAITNQSEGYHLPKKNPIAIGGHIISEALKEVNRYLQEERENQKSGRLELVLGVIDDNALGQMLRRIQSRHFRGLGQTMVLDWCKTIPLGARTQFLHEEALDWIEDKQKGLLAFNIGGHYIGVFIDTVTKTIHLIEPRGFPHLKAVVNADEYSLAPGSVLPVTSDAIENEKVTVCQEIITALRQYEEFKDFNVKLSLPRLQAEGSNDCPIFVAECLQQLARKSDLSSLYQACSTDIKRRRKALELRAKHHNASRNQEAKEVARLSKQEEKTQAVMEYCFQKKAREYDATHATDDATDVTVTGACVLIADTDAGEFIKKLQKMEQGILLVNVGEYFAEHYVGFYKSGDRVICIYPEEGFYPTPTDYRQGLYMLTPDMPIPFQTLPLLKDLFLQLQRAGITCEVSLEKTVEITSVRHENKKFAHYFLYDVFSNMLSGGFSYETLAPSLPTMQAEVVARTQATPIEAQQEKIEKEAREVSQESLKARYEKTFNAVAAHYAGETGGMVEPPSLAALVRPLASVVSPSMPPVSPRVETTLRK